MAKENTSKSKSISLRLSEDDYERLKKKAQAQGVPMAAVLLDSGLSWNRSMAVLTKESVKCIKNISEGVRELKGDYKRIIRYESKEELENAVDRIDYVEKEIKKLWQSLR